MAPKKDKSNFVLRNKADQVLIKSPGSLNGSAFAIANCTNCEIYIFDHIAQIFVDDSTNCKIYIGPTKGSVFARDCSNIELHSSSSQLRISDSKNIKAFVFAQSDPTLENTSGLVLAPYVFLYPGFVEHFNAAGLIGNQDKWSQVFDFTPNKEGIRNWTLLNPSEFTGPFVKEIEGVEGDTSSPIPLSTTYGGDSDVEIIIGSSDDNNKVENGMACFSIGVSQQQAVQIFEAVEQHEQQQQEQQQSEQQQQQQKLEQVQQQLLEQEQQQQQFEQSQQQKYEQQQQQQEQQQQEFQLNNFGQNNDGFVWGNQDQSQQNQNIVSGVPVEDDDWGTGYTAPQAVQQKSILEQKEEELRNLSIQKQNLEYQQKNERRNAARQFLQNFIADKKKKIQSNLQRATQEEDAIKQASKLQESKIVNPWEKITSNIALKPGDAPSKSDLSSMRQAILNKRSDNK